MRLGLAAFLVFFPSFLWAHDVQSVRFADIGGEIILETEGTGVDERSLFAIASVGKTFTSVAVLRLVERGLISLDAKVAGILPRDDTADLDGMEGVTLRHLLTMTSGIADYYTDDYLDAALDDPARWQSPRAALDFVAGEPALFAPGDGFDYSNTNYLLLGLVLEELTGLSYAAVLDQEVFRPAGMTESFVFGSRPLPESFVTGHSAGGHVRDYYAGQGFGDGGALSSARDLVRFYTALFTERRLLGEASLREMRRDPGGANYGMGLVAAGDLVGHTGGDLGFASDVVMNIATGDVAVVLVGEEDGDTDWAYEIIAGQ